MSRTTSRSRKPWLISMIVGVAALCAATQACADRPRSEEQATAAGRAMVAAASQGSVDAAFQSAQQLRRTNDQRLAQSLDLQKQALLGQSATRGVPKRIQLIDESHLVDCITREFLVRYDSGDLRWVLKFRPGNGGYYLYDLNIVGLSA